MNAMKVHSADISHFQKTVDLAKAKKAGLLHVYHKCTQGQSWKDDRYVERRTEARKIGLPFGAYHFAETATTPEVQAQHFVNTAGIKPGDMAPMLDLEDYSAGKSFFSRMSVTARTAWVGRWIAAVRKSAGVKDVIIYTNLPLSDHFGCPLWVARYNDDNRAPRVPAPWTTWTIWQFSNGINGVPNSFPGLGHCDLNTMNGDAARLTKTFTIPKAVVTPKPKPPVVTPPTKRKTASIRVSTANIQNFPDMSKADTSEDIHTAMHVSDLVLWQEIGEAEDHAAIKASGGSAWHKTETNRETPISARLNVLRPVGSPIVTKVADGLGVGSKSPPRWMVEQQYTWAFPTDLPDVWAISIHYVQQAWGPKKVSKVAERQKQWNGAHAIHKEHALAAVKKGFVVVGGGDWNRNVGDIPKFQTTQKWIIGGGGLDHVYVLTPPGITTGFGSTVQKNIHSDHDLRTVLLSIGH